MCVAGLIFKSSLGGHDLPCFLESIPSLFKALLAGQTGVLVSDQSGGNNTKPNMTVVAGVGYSVGWNISPRVQSKTGFFLLHLFADV